MLRRILTPFVLTVVLIIFLLLTTSQDSSRVVLPEPTDDSSVIPAEATNPEWQPFSSAMLRWPLPQLVNPELLQVEVESDTFVYHLDPNRDYVVQMPDQPLRRGLFFVGGRNVVMIGGEIFIPWQGDEPTIEARTALKIKDATGVVHIEGLLLHGDDISEGIQIDAPLAIVQLQNIGVFNLQARDQVDFTDNHPDVVQTYGNVAELRIDQLTGSTDYQGLFLSADFDGPHGPVYISRTNILGAPTARKLIWFNVEEGAGRVILENVWIDVPTGYEFNNAVWPTSYGSYPAQAQMGMTADDILFATWPAAMSPQVSGRVFQGVPPEGNFVDPEDVGLGYAARSEME